MLLKARVGPASDPLEREADRVADAVVADRPVGTISSAGAAMPQRKCSACESEEVLHRKESGTGAGGQGQAERAARTVSHGGAALTAGQRAYYEPRFGRDLSTVRLHTDARAMSAASDIGARAYTFGSHIAFAGGEFDSDSLEGRRLLAHEITHTLQQGPAGSGVQRQPNTEIEMPAEWAFAADKRKATDVRYAKSLAQADAKRIRKAGSLSASDRGVVTARLQFFEGDAWQTYSDMIRPVLIEATQVEIEMPGDTPAPAAAAAPAATPSPMAGWEESGRFNMLRKEPTYIDNEIKTVNYFTAELARLNYKDGTSYDLGLVPRWMKPPVVEVDCHTPAQEIRKYQDATTKQLGFMLEPEMATAPRTLPYGELLKKYVHNLDFYIEQGTARIVPSRINQLTTPTICGVLNDSERRFGEQVDMAVQIGLGGTIAIGAYAGQGGLPKNVGVGLSTATAARVLTPTARALSREMDSLLASGASKTLEAEGVQLAGVTAKMEGKNLSVSRFMSKLPEALRGQGTGTRVTAAFEDAAAEVGRLNNAKTVTVDVGIIINPGWRELLEARGYVRTFIESESGGAWSWIKIINL